jgi:hypothetical protein
MQTTLMFHIMKYITIIVVIVVIVSSLGIWVYRKALPFPNSTKSASITRVQTPFFHHACHDYISNTFLSITNFPVHK